MARHKQLSIVQILNMLIWSMKRKGKFQKKSSNKSIGILCISVALVAAISYSAAILLNRSNEVTHIASNERNEAQLPVSAEPSNPTATVNSQNMTPILLDLFVPLNNTFHGTYVSKTTATQTGSGISRTVKSTLEWEDGSDSKEIMRKHIDFVCHFVFVIERALHHERIVIFLP